MFRLLDFLTSYVLLPFFLGTLHLNRFALREFGRPARRRLQLKKLDALVCRNGNQA